MGVPDSDPNLHVRERARAAFRQDRLRGPREGVIRRGLQVSAGISILTSFGILFILVKECLPFFEEVSVVSFLTGTRWAPLMEPRHYGVLPLIGGTLLVTAVATLIVVPVGSLTGIYLSEYAADRTRRKLKPLLEILAGIPTVVYGYFCLLYTSPSPRDATLSRMPSSA